MIHRLLLVAIIAAFVTVAASSETFPSGERKITIGKTVTVRGVINPVTVPVGDELELGMTQSGYFLFTAEMFRVDGEDGLGELVKVRDQSFFHLIVSGDLESRVKGLIGRPVEVTASVVAAHTRYHRTPVLLDVKTVSGLEE